MESSQDHLDNKNLIEKMKERFKNQTNGSEDSDTNIIKEKIKKLTQPQTQNDKTVLQITESQIKKMNKEAQLLGQTLTLMLERFQ